MKVQLAPTALVLLSLFSIACAGKHLTQSELSDPAIKARVEERLRATPNLDIKFISVDAHERVVTVSGLVDSLDDRWKVERVAKGVPGVEQVITNLAIRNN